MKVRHVSCRASWHGGVPEAVALAGGGNDLSVMEEAVEVGAGSGHVLEQFAPADKPTNNSRTRSEHPDRAHRLRLFPISDRPMMPISTCVRGAGVSGRTTPLRASTVVPRIHVLMGKNSYPDNRLYNQVFHLFSVCLHPGNNHVKRNGRFVIFPAIVVRRHRYRLIGNARFVCQHHFRTG